MPDPATYIRQVTPPSTGPHQHSQHTPVSGMCSVGPLLRPFILLLFYSFLFLQALGHIMPIPSKMFL